MNDVRTRIAPSPTGEDLHIGNAYTALINYIFAKKNNGKFIVRIEDTDRTRLVEGSEEKILSSLKWLGISPDESPQIGGPFAPYRQSERLEKYKTHAEELIEKGHAYYCFCTPERLEEMRRKQQEEKIPPMYDGRCRNLDIKESRERIKKGERYTIRLKVQKEGITSFTDIIRGTISFENKLIDDQVLLKSDGYPTYHLGVVVDDHIMTISHVIRGEEWISSTPKHIILYASFGWNVPYFAHVPLLRNPDKSKLSKRKNPVWVSWYKQQGFLSEALLNYLGLMGWSMPDGRDIFTLDELVKNFRLEDVKTTAPIFDIKKLEWMNGEYIKKSRISHLTSQIYEYYNKRFSQDTIEKTIPLIKERIKKLSDYLPLCEFFFNRPEKYEIELGHQKEVLSKLSNTLNTVGNWKSEGIGKAMQELVDKEKYQSSDFFMVVRVAITGNKISPPLNESMELLGKDEILDRLKFLQ